MIKILQQINKTPRRKKIQKACYQIELYFHHTYIQSILHYILHHTDQSSDYMQCQLCNVPHTVEYNFHHTTLLYILFIKKNIEIVNTYAMFTHVKKKRDIERTIQTFIIYHYKLSLYFLDTLPLSSRDYIRNTLHFVCCKFCFYSSQGTGYHIQSHRHQI